MSKENSNAQITDTKPRKITVTFGNGNLPETLDDTISMDTIKAVRIALIRVIQGGDAKEFKNAINEILTSYGSKTNYEGNIAGQMIYSKYGDVANKFGVSQTTHEIAGNQYRRARNDFNTLSVREGTKRPPMYMETKSAQNDFESRRQIFQKLNETRFIFGAHL